MVEGEGSLVSPSAKIGAEQYQLPIQRVASLTNERFPHDFIAI
jgi:hypothetical protein